MRKEVKNMQKTEIGREDSLSVEKLRGERLELLPDRIELHRRHRNRRRHNRHFFDHNHDRFDNRFDDGRDVVVVDSGDPSGGDDD
jgi:hypothetical protein